MDYILSIETAATICSVAVHEQGNLLATASCHIPQAHHRSVVKMVREVLAVGGVGIETLKAVAVSHGPGSYTGLRIGLSVAKGLAYGRDIPLITINTLAIMLQGARAYAPEAKHLCALMDAGRGRAYRMVADALGATVSETAACKVDVASITPWLAPAPLYVMGSGAEKYADVFEGVPEICVMKGIYAKAADIGAMAYQKFVQKEWEDIAYVEPLYVNAFAPQ